ncbi:MAG: hypothetical protein ACKO28_10845 [Cyanobium sp.]|jgi:hypothetical protein
MPELDGLLPADLSPMLEKGGGLTRDQFTAGELQRLAPSIPTGWPEMQHLASIADPSILGGEGRPVACCHTT